MRRQQTTPRKRCLPDAAAAETSCATTRLPSKTGLVQRLLRRQVAGGPVRSRQAFQRECLVERFSNYRVRLTLDMFAPLHVDRAGLQQQLDQRHRIEEICAVDDLVVGLAENGICCAFDLRTGCRTCIVNSSHEEVIRSLFHNKIDGTLVVVSVFAADQYSSLRCRATPVSEIQHGITSGGVALFESESLRYPGFVEFDEQNGKVLTFSADVHLYRVSGLNVQPAAPEPCPCMKPHTKTHASRHS